ncbi:hypothetical protein vBPaerPs25_126 [Pseudomonas phage vB_Paer_Ps25]|uniref:Uncharacterized protein n=1 Tax=Pseudomonas phage vB_Paer_Ps12 TaxID=2924904 RepID=A0AAE9KE03_9CAUD|nr:hypothetical protein QE347_gp127 [Pseudomonas phage vB_Paer_Ps12]UOL47583.1 hypothetical protein vBPaerPs12_127 [Pseudomonas phage vB_Paer_Ps12]UOL47770.1 hypothetical protein vBPaerPs25_126 [Pseudomonas phage vB_Paer_Ps25]
MLSDSLQPLSFCNENCVQFIMRLRSDFTLHAEACYSIPCDSSAIPFCMAHELHKHDKGNPRKRSFQSVGFSLYYNCDSISRHQKT